jgi:hypothetical protein
VNETDPPPDADPATETDRATVSTPEPSSAVDEVPPVITTSAAIEAPSATTTSVVVEATAAATTRSTGPMTMAEYEEASSPRAELARARGLAAPYIPGGRDPNPEQGLREERHYMRLLVAMVVAIVGGGFALSILYVLVTGGN